MRFFDTNLLILVLLLSTNALFAQQVSESAIATLDSICSTDAIFEQSSPDSLLEHWIATATDTQRVTHALRAGKVMLELRLSKPGIELLEDDELLSAARQVPDQYITLLTLLGGLYLDAGLINQSLQVLAKADTVATGLTQLSDTKLTDLYITYGKTLTRAGKYGDAILYHDKSIALAKMIGDSMRVQDNLNEKGNLFGSIGLYEEAIDQFLARLEYDPNRSTYSLAYMYTNIARCYLEMGEYNSAIAYYRRMLSIENFPEDIAYAKLYAINGLVETYYYKGHLDSVRLSNRQLQREFEAQGSNEQDAFLITQAQVFEDILQGRHTNAETALQSLYAEARTNQSAPEIIAYAQQLADNYRAWNRPVKALNYQDIAQRLKDSTRTANKTHALVLYQTIHKTQERVQENKQLRADAEVLRLRTQRTQLLLGGGILLLLGIGSFVLIRQRNRQRIRRAVAIERLRNQISTDLHDDVGSMLTSMSMSSELLSARAPEDLRPSITTLTNTSRQAMLAMRDAVWLMNAEQDNWAQLVDRLREFGRELFEDTSTTFQLTTEGIQASERLDPLWRKHLYLITKEALTNVTKHASAALVDVSFVKNAKQLTFQIKNDGASSTASSTGLGLASMRQRAEALGGTLNVDKAGGDFCINVSVPLG